MKKNLFFILTAGLIFSFLLLFVAAPVLAGSQFQSGLSATGSKTTLNAGNPQLIAAKIVQTLLSIVGLIFVVLIIYSGFRYMTSAGEEDKVKKAKRTIIGAVIGLFIIISGYSISWFIVSNLESPDQQIPPFREECEVSSTQNYYSINCCLYRYQSYGGNVSAECCNQTSFCTHSADITQKCSDQGITCQ